MITLTLDKEAVTLILRTLRTGRNLWAQPLYKETSVEATVARNKVAEYERVIAAITDIVGGEL